MTSEPRKSDEYMKEWERRRMRISIPRKFHEDFISICIRDEIKPNEALEMMLELWIKERKRLHKIDDRGKKFREE